MAAFFFWEGYKFSINQIITGSDILREVYYTIINIYPPIPGVKWVLRWGGIRRECLYWASSSGIHYKENIWSYHHTRCGGTSGRDMKRRQLRRNSPLRVRATGQTREPGNLWTAWDRGDSCILQAKFEWFIHQDYDQAGKTAFYQVLGGYWE